MYNFFLYGVVKFYTRSCFTTLYNVRSVHRGCSVHRGVFSTSGDIMSTLGDIMSTSGDVQYIGRIP